ncbi:MAG: nucleotidyltransferase family protein [Gammaproteobacteria bacterium]
MNSIDHEQFLELLRRPSAVTALSLKQWDSLLPMLSQTRLLPHIVAAIDQENIGHDLPARIADHLESTRVRTRRHAKLVEWEIDRLDSLFCNRDEPIVLLKGAAYLCAGLSPALGRVYSDVDVLVRKPCIDEIERDLLAHDWSEVDDPDNQEQFFRRWLHEIRPLKHRRRATVLDLHHNILPAIDSLQFDASLLFERIEKIEGTHCIHVLGPADMVIHACVHLFRNGDFSRGLRDLLDIRALLRDFRALDPRFDEEVQARAECLGVSRPCALAFRFLDKYLRDEALSAPPSNLEYALPNSIELATLDFLFRKASLPRSLGANPVPRQVSHWLLERYPPHLVRKTIVPKLERFGIYTLRPKH